MDYKQKFELNLTRHFKTREIANLWRIVKEDVFQPSGFSRFDEIINRLKRGEPVQYITGIEHFYGSVFSVNEHVLIPRPETEELVHWVLESHGNDPKRVLDIGTGSGCIACTLKLNRPNWHVDGIDVSSAALDIAKENSKRLGCIVDFTLSDIRRRNFIRTKYDIIVSNPPYVLESEKSDMESSVLNFEPAQALFVADDDPLYYYRCILEDVKRNTSRAVVYFEIHPELIEKMETLFQDFGAQKFTCKQDLQGANRLVMGKFNTEEQISHE